MKTKTQSRCKCENANSKKIICGKMNVIYCQNCFEVISWEKIKSKNKISIIDGVPTVKTKGKNRQIIFNI